MTGAAPATLPATFQDQMVQIISELGASGFVRTVLRFDGRLDPALLGRAARLLLDAEPVLAGVLDARARPPVWRRRADADLDALAHVRLVEAAEEAPALAAIAAERMPAEAPANLGLVLIRLPLADTLVLTMSHVPADGTALLDTCRKLARLYGRLLAEPGFVPELNRASRDSFDWLQSFGWRERLAMLRADVAAAKRRRGPSWGIASDPARFQAERQRLEPAHHEHRLAPERVLRLDAVARARQVTLNDLLLAAYFRAYAAVFPPPAGARLEITVPTNMRRYAPRQAEPAIRNLGSVIFMGIGSELGTGFADTLDLVAAETRRHKRRLLGTELQLPQLLLRRMPYRWKRALLHKVLREQLTRPNPPTFTNVGALAPAAVRFGALVPVQAVILTEAAPPPVFLLTLLRFGDDLAFGLGYDANGLAPELIARFFSRLDRELAEAEALPAA